MAGDIFTQEELDEHWQYASPGGGFVTSEWRPAITFAPGQVIERAGRWVLVERVQSTEQRLGLTWISTADGATRLFCANEGACVRTDL